MIAAEQGVLLAQDEGQMVRGMTGRGQGLQRPAVAGHDLAIGQDPVGLEVVVIVLLDRHGGVMRTGEGGGGQHRRPGRL